MTTTGKEYPGSINTMLDDMFPQRAEQREARESLKLLKRADFSNRVEFFSQNPDSDILTLSNYLVKSGMSNLQPYSGEKKPPLERVLPHASLMESLPTSPYLYTRETPLPDISVVGIETPRRQNGMLRSRLAEQLARYPLASDVSVSFSLEEGMLEAFLGAYGMKLHGEVEDKAHWTFAPGGMPDVRLVFYSPVIDQDGTPIITIQTQPARLSNSSSYQQRIMEAVVNVSGVKSLPLETVELYAYDIPETESMSKGGPTIDLYPEYEY